MSRSKPMYTAFREWMEDQDMRLWDGKTTTPWEALQAFTQFLEAHYVIKRKAVPTAAGRDAQAFIQAYCDAFRERFKKNPVIRAKDAGIAKRVTKDLGLHQAVELVRSYVWMRDGFVYGRGYPLEMFEGNLNKIKLSITTGRTLTQTEGREMENTDYNREVARRYLEGTE